LIVGGPYDKSGSPNKCDVNNIANPDSVFVDTAGNLWIGEDTSNHKNNILWRYDTKAAKLDRFAILPVGAETTGFSITPLGDIFVNIQHPSGMNPFPYNRGIIGAVVGFEATQVFESLPAPVRPVTEMTIASGTYQILARSGETIPGDIFGQRFGQISNLAGSILNICNNPDGNMFLQADGVGNAGFLYTNYECQPGGVSKIYIKKGESKWDILDGENVDFSAVNGTWNNCGASVTPWNTAMSAEEYEPAALQDTWKQNVQPMSDYLGKQANPYHYGWLVEMSPDTSGDTLKTLVTKRYSMGRFSHEMAAFAPDGKTVYNGDDGANVVLFKFVADKITDLSAGTLYAAAITQNADESFAITWIELGKSDDKTIAAGLKAIKLP
jgi:secreted PhoX family phosphatase